VSAATGIDPRALRDCAADDPLLFDELREAADRWTAELELQASQLEISWTLVRALASGPGGRPIPPLAVPRSRTLTRERRRVSVAELAGITGRTVREVEP
jgi:hypothetical protein